MMPYHRIIARVAPAGCFSAFFLCVGMTWGQNLILEGPQADTNRIFAGEPVTFRVRADTLGTSPLAYSWNFGEGSGNTPYTADNHREHVFTRPGRYMVFARVKEGNYVESRNILQIVFPKPTSSKPTSAGPIIYDASLRRVWTVNPDNNTVTAIDAEKLTRLFERPVGRNPRTLARAPDGAIWVANQDEATVSVLDSQTGDALALIRLPYASRPYGIAFSPDGKFGYVTLEATGKLLRLDPSSRGVTGSVTVCPTPRGIAVSHDGKRVLVTRFIAAKEHGEVTEIDGSTFTLVRTHILEYDPSSDSENAGGGTPNYISSIAISPDGKHAWYAAKKDNTRRGVALNGDTLTFESTVRTFVGRLDMEKGAEDARDRFDLDNSDQASAVAFNPYGDLAYIAVQGANRVDVMDPYNNGTVNVQIKGVGLAPQGLVLDDEGKYLFVKCFMSRSVHVYALAALQTAIKEIDRAHKVILTVASEKLAPQVLRGKQIFYNAADTRMNKDGYISCATCHLEGRTDSRVWDFTDRGEGLRKTHTLLGRGGMGHGPVHHSANFDEIQDFEHDMRGPFGGTGFMTDKNFFDGNRNTTLGPPKAGASPELDALAAYVASLDRVHPSPYRNADGSMTSEALAGEKIFRRSDVGCAQCHSGSHFTDSRLPGPDSSALNGDHLAPGSFLTPQGFLLHDVGTLKPKSGKRLKDTLMGLDTPTLKGLWQNPPYLHDGSAETLLDVFTTANAGDRHGKTSHLTESEKKQLLAFLMQLDETDAQGTSLGIIAANSGKPSLLTLSLSRQGGQWRLEASGLSSSESPKLSFFDLHGRTISVPYQIRGMHRPGVPLVWHLDDPRIRALPRGQYLIHVTSGARRAASKVSLP